jgi:MMP 1-O-methyltransferase
MNFETALDIAQVIPTWMERQEKELLFALAQEVPANGTVVEVGCLYGGSTALIGLGQPLASIHIFDDFSWSPLETMLASRETLLTNLEKVGVPNEVAVTVGDSRETGKHWQWPIDLLWVDGGHSLEFVSSDLANFGPHAKVIACHDYDNPAWPTIRMAVEAFIAKNPQWRVTRVAGTLVVLRRQA